MALILIVIIMTVWLGIVWSLFASINPFVYKLWTVTNYNAAYYGAIMWVERWMLALRYHEAWFEWSSSLTSWHLSDSVIAHDFGRLTTDPSAQIWWTIKSRTENSIPASWQWNIEPLFAWSGSNMFNSLSYFEGLELPLYLDNTTLVSQFYTTPPAWNIVNISPNAWTLYLSWTFRVPPKIKAWLNNEWLDESIDIDSDTISDDIIVNRWLKGNDILAWSNFSIIPTIRNNFTLWTPIYEQDNAIRESIINAWDWWYNINTDATTFHFINSTSSLLAENNILPLSSQYKASWFNDILNENESAITWLTLDFNITNRMRTAGGNIYPFLEWQIVACDLWGCASGIELPDRFFTLEWLGTVGSYSVRLQVKKPVRETSNASNFTIIF